MYVEHVHFFFCMFYILVAVTIRHSGGGDCNGILGAVTVRHSGGDDYKTFTYQILIEQNVILTVVRSAQ